MILILTLHIAHQPHHQEQQVLKQKRKKGPARRENDRARAAAHQQSLLLSEKAAQASTDKVVPALNFPFNGIILPLKKPTPEATLKAQTTTLSSSLVVTPPKKSSFKSNHNFKNYVDASSVKKQLFPQPLPQGKLQAAAPPSPKKNYQEKENDIWTRMFNI